MEEATLEEQISMEPVSPSGTEAAEDLSSSPKPFVETNKESSKVIGQLEETVNAEVNSEAAVVSKGPVIIDDSSTEELSADEPIGEATGEISSGEQEAAASKVQIATTKTQKNKAYRDKCKAFLLEYGFHARQLGPMKNSTMDMHIRDIKAKVARGELPSIEQIRARKESLMRGLGLGGGARIEFPLSGTGIREGEEVMCGEATKAMFPKMFPLNPKEEQISPPSSPPMDNMPISSVIKIKKGQQTKRKQSTSNPDPERLSQDDERRTKPSSAEDTGSQPTATTGAAVESTVEAQQARVLRSQATAQDKPRFIRRKSMARRKKKTKTVSFDSEPDASLSITEVTPEAAPKTKQSREDMRDIRRLMHEHSYIPLVNWSFNAQERIFILTDYNGEIKLVDLVHLIVLAKPYIFDLDKLPLNNPDNGADGRSAIRLIRKRAQVLRGTWKPRLYKTTASEESSHALKTKTSEVYPLTKTVAAYSHNTKGTDTRHAGLSKDKDNM
ncbi:hypothetical protein E3N88_31915 [Mikania micrantha]|uniref:Uncharacterized protein n=1 Tax=Mikania micrantha TaxID=192012 RepID=A0A5N6M7J5_9ASTR|nr:hypothetical protein E3N88_31915 [Mikania micrantha]